MRFESTSDLGLLVWQDFMFACGQYPAYDDFVAEVKAEAEQAVLRLRHHPSMAIYGKHHLNFCSAYCPTHCIPNKH